MIKLCNDDSKCNKILTTYYKILHIYAAKKFHERLSCFKMQRDFDLFLKLSDSVLSDKLNSFTTNYTDTYVMLCYLMLCHTMLSYLMLCYVMI